VRGERIAWLRASADLASIGGAGNRLRSGPSGIESSKLCATRAATGGPTTALILQMEFFHLVW